MTPPIRNSLLSHRGSPLLGEETLPAPLNHEATQSLAQERWDAMENAEAGWLRGASQWVSRELNQQNGFGTRSQEQVLGEVAANLRRINEIEANGETGRRPTFYFLLRDLYLLIQHANDYEGSTPARWVSTFLSVANRYQNFLNRNYPSESKRFHYLYTATQVTHGLLSHLMEHQSEVVENTWENHAREPVQSLLRQYHRQLLGYFEGMEAQDDPARESVRDLVMDIQIREAILDSDPALARQWALQLMAYRQMQPGQTDSNTWFDRWEIRHRQRPAYQEDLRGLIQNSAPPQSLYINGLGFELLARVALGLDAVNELNEAQIKRRYRVMSLIFSALSFRYPGKDLADILQTLEEPSSENTLVEVIRHQVDAHSFLSESLEELLQDAPGSNLAGLVREAQTVSREWKNFREGAGRRLMTPILESNHRAFKQFSQANSQDTLLRDALWDPHQFEIWESVLQDAETYEIPALHSLANFVANMEPLDAEYQIPQAMRLRAQTILNEMESFPFRAGQVLHPIFSLNGILTLGLGVTAGELFPSYLLGLSRGKKLGNLVRDGRITTAGALTSGAVTGISLSAVGSALENADRYRAGLNTFFWRDFRGGAILNSAIFGAAAGTGHFLTRVLRPNLTSGMGFDRLAWGRQALIRGGSMIVGGTTAWMGTSLARRLERGIWSTSPEEIASAYVTLLAFELGALGFRQLRHRAALRSELGLQYWGESNSPSARWENRLSKLLVNRRFPILGESGSQQVQNLATLLRSERRGPLGIQPRESAAYDGEAGFLVEQLGLFSMNHPNLDSPLQLLVGQPGHLAVTGSRSGRSLRWANFSYPETSDSIPPPRPSQPREASSPTPVSPEADTQATRPGEPRDSNRSRPQETPPPETAPDDLPFGEMELAEPTEPSHPAAATTQMEIAPGPRRIEAGSPPHACTDPNTSSAIRGAREELRLGELGEVTVITDVGGREANEDAYGLWYDRNGNAVLMVADGMGGHAHGDEASARAVQGFFDFLMGRPSASLFEAFQAAHRNVQALAAGNTNTPPGSAASAVRVSPDGRVEMAQIGDTQVFVARRQTDGSYQVQRVAMPDSHLGAIRDSLENSGNDHQMTTLFMHGDSAIGSFLGRPDLELSPIYRVSQRKAGTNPVVHRPEFLTAPDGTSVYRLQEGDLLLLMSDGAEGQLTTAEIQGMLGQRTSTNEITAILEAETRYRQDLALQSDEVPQLFRQQIRNGNFQGFWLDAEGMVWPGQRGGEAVASTVRDNYTLMVYRHGGQN
jgi:serine/threonine protein phosphatase PrpC